MMAMSMVAGAGLSASGFFFGNNSLTWLLGSWMGKFGKVRLAPMATCLYHTCVRFGLGIMRIVHCTVDDWNRMTIPDNHAIIMI